MLQLVLQPQLQLYRPTKPLYTTHVARCLARHNRSCVIVQLCKNLPQPRQGLALRQATWMVSSTLPVGTNCKLSVTSCRPHTLLTVLLRCVLSVKHKHHLYLRNNQINTHIHTHHSQHPDVSLNLHSSTRCQHRTLPSNRHTTTSPTAALNSSAAACLPSLCSQQLHCRNGWYPLAQLLRNCHAHRHDIGCWPCDLDFDDRPVDAVQNKLAPTCAY